jgi:hypothetical protein
MKLTAPVLACSLLLAACRSKEPVSEAPAAETAQPTASAQPRALAPAPETDRMAAARQSLAAGDFDQAAARLFELRATGKEFSAQEAAAFREILEDVYAAAVEANAKGDPRAPATLQLIKGATAR